MSTTALKKPDDFNGDGHMSFLALYPAIKAQSLNCLVSFLSSDETPVFLYQIKALL
jgi:hypothetical protein